MQSWRPAHPLAEIHWRQSAEKYGLRDTEKAKAYWRSSCTKDTAVSMIPGNRVIVMTSSAGVRRLVCYDSFDQLKVYLRMAYRLAGSGFACKRGSVGVIRLMSRSLKGHPGSFVLVCVDILKLQTLATVMVNGRGGKTDFHHVEVYNVARNTNGNLIALSVGMIHESDFLHEAFENVVIIYDCNKRMEICRVDIGHMIAAVAFDPRSSNAQFSIAGMPERDGTRSLTTFSLQSEKAIRSTSIQGMIDIEGETQVELSYSQQGSLLILQVLEPVGYSQEWMYNTYVYDADTMTPIARCSPSLLLACHMQCTPIAAPLVSACGTFMALGNYCANQKADPPMKVYRLPCQLDLMKQCRSVILRSIPDPGAIQQLPLPKPLKSFLAWNYENSEPLSHKRPLDENSNETPCQCPTKDNDADTKDASWYTGVDDVKWDPERCEIRVHPRARNETYS